MGYESKNWRIFSFNLDVISTEALIEEKIENEDASLRLLYFVRVVRSQLYHRLVNIEKRIFTFFDLEKRIFTSLAFFK